MECKRVCCVLLIFVLNTAYADNIPYAAGWELWYPYQYHNKKGQLIGLDIDSFNAIAQQANIKFHYLEVNWKRHLQMIKTGKMDIAFGASFNHDRAQYAYFTSPYRIEKVNLFVKKGTRATIKLDQLSDLITSKYIIGVEAGYFYGKEYQELSNNPEFLNHINEVIDLEQNVTMLLKGHIDGFLVDPVTIKAFAERYSMEQEFELHSLPIHQDEIHIMLSKKTCSPALLDAFNKAIKRLKNNGELARIMARWQLNNQ